MKNKKAKTKKVGAYYEHKPKHEFKASLSQDGKFWIFREITTHIVPESYLRSIKADTNPSIIEEGSSEDSSRSKDVAG